MYECNCREGFILREDGYSCYGEFGIYFGVRPLTATVLSLGNLKGSVSLQEGSLNKKFYMASVSRDRGEFLFIFPQVLASNTTALDGVGGRVKGFERN